MQLARARGATPVAVAGADKAGALREMGAERVVPRGDGLIDALGRDSVDVVVDLVGGPAWPELLEVLRPFGRYAVSGAIGGAFVELDLRTLYLKDLSFFGCTVIEQEVFPNLVTHLEAGRVRPAVSATWPLRDIAKAQAAFEEKRHVGKIVLTVANGA